MSSCQVRLARVLFRAGPRQASWSSGGAQEGKWSKGSNGDGAGTNVLVGRIHLLFQHGDRGLDDPGRSQTQRPDKSTGPGANLDQAGKRPCLTRRRWSQPPAARPMRGLRSQHHRPACRQPEPPGLRHDPQELVEADLLSRSVRRNSSILRRIQASCMISARARNTLRRSRS